MDQNLIELGAQALKKAALNHEAKEYVLQNPPLFKALKKAADRYIGGETLPETLQKVIHANGQGYKCSVEFMGENTSTEKEARKATDEFVRIARQTEEQQLYSTISLDLSHIGLGISRELGFYNLTQILKAATSNNTEVTISAESFLQTDDVIHTYLEAAKQFENVSITMQAYLYRSRDDFKELIKQSGRVRLVKGAFDTPAHHALPRGPELDEIYLNYLDQLLSRKHKCSIATHHEFIQQEAIKLIEFHEAAKDDYEFESLYGIQSEQLEAIKAKGHPAKIYFVYGKEWYLYLCNRIAEYPLNIFHAIHDVVN